MLSIIGTYDNGFVKFDEDYAIKKPVKVIVTFLKDIQSKANKELTLSDFSFAKSKNNLKDYKGSFAESVVEERRNEL